MIKVVLRILNIVALIVFAYFVFLQFFKKGGEKQIVKEISPPETVYVRDGKVVYRTQKIYVPRVDTIVKRDTIYLTQSGIWQARVERRLLDHFVLIDTIKFSIFDDVNGFLDLYSFLYQEKPIPLYIDFRLKDKEFYYVFSTSKPFEGRFSIYTRYYDERNPFRIYGGIGLFLGKNLSLNLSTLYKEKYLVTGQITTSGDVGLSLQIKLSDLYLWRK